MLKDNELVASLSDAIREAEEVAFATLAESRRYSRVRARRVSKARLDRRWGAITRRVGFPVDPIEPHELARSIVHRPNADPPTAQSTASEPTRGTSA